MVNFFNDEVEADVVGDEEAPEDEEATETTEDAA